MLPCESHVAPWGQQKWPGVVSACLTPLLALAGVGVVAELGNGVVVLVQNGDPPAQVGDDHFRAALTEVAGPPEPAGVVLGFFSTLVDDQVIELAFEREVLQPMVLAVGNHDQRLGRVARVAEDAMGACRLVIGVPFPAESPDVFALDVVVMDVPGAVAVGDIEVAVGGEGRERRHVGLRIGVAGIADLVLCVFGVIEGHQDLALEVGLEDLVHAGGRQVEDFLAVLLAEVHAVGVAGIFLAPGFDELAVGVVDVHRFGAGVMDEDPSVGGLLDRVGVAEGLVRRALGPVADPFELVIALAEDRRLVAGLVVGVEDRRELARRQPCGNAGGNAGLDELAPGRPGGAVIERLG